MEPREAHRRVGAAIAAARATAGMTQLELGRATGLGQTVVSRIECGRRRVDAPELTRFAATLGVGVDTLMSPADHGAEYEDHLRRLHDAQLTAALAWIPGFFDDMKRLERLNEAGP